VFRLLFLALIICTLSACTLALPSTPQPTPLVTDIDPEEYALFSAMLDQNIVGYHPDAPVVIRDQTSPDIDHLEFALKGPHDLPKELVQAYRLRNDQPYTLDANFALKRAYTLMPQAEYDELLRTGGASWEDFEGKYPQAKGVFFFSRAGLNAARDEAVVSISYYCGSLCTEGGVFLMVKQDGVWKVEQEVASWMA
jgi:hypothetical protein